MTLTLKRVYEPSEPSDGVRILVDRLWPRGLTKEKANIDVWLKDVAPSTELRKWFHHDPEKWKTFKQKYVSELKKNKENVAHLKEHIKKGKVTLVYASKDEEHNEAVVLKDFLQK